MGLTTVLAPFFRTQDALQFVRGPVIIQSRASSSSAAKTLIDGLMIAYRGAVFVSGRPCAQSWYVLFAIARPHCALHTALAVNALTCPP